MARVPPLGRALPRLLCGQRQMGVQKARADAHRHRRRHARHRRHKRLPLHPQRQGSLRGFHGSPQEQGQDAPDCVPFEFRRGQGFPRAVRTVLHGLSRIRGAVVQMGGQAAHPRSRGHGLRPDDRKLHRAQLVVRVRRRLVQRRQKQMAVGRLLPAECGLVRQFQI